MATVDRNTVARVLNVSPQRVSQLSHESGFPAKPAHGEYDLNQITLWYIRHLQAELKRRGPTGTVGSADMQAEKLGLVAAQRVKAETENKVRRGELLERDSVRVVLIQRLSNCQKQLRSIPSSIGPQLTNKSDPAYIVERLKCAIDQALTELAGGYDGGRTNVDDGQDGLGAAARIYGEPMGGRETPAIE